MLHNLTAKNRKRFLAEDGPGVKAWGQDLSVALIYPNSYGVAMSNLGFQLVYRLINEEEGVLCDRAFLPDRDEMSGFEMSGHLITTLERDRPLIDYDVIAFSVPFEHDYTNILKILADSEFPFYSSERDDSHPIIISGGVTSHLNPEPIADFMDLFAVGEGEVLIPSLIKSLKGFSGLDRKEVLLKLSALEGIYVPSLYEIRYKEDGAISSSSGCKGAPEKIRRQWIDQSGFEKSSGGSTVLGEDIFFKEMYLLEVGRGCGRGCRFCAAGFINLPPRERKSDDLKADIEKGIKKDKRIGLISPSLADHSEIGAICEYIDATGGTSSLSSVRADALREDYMGHVKKGGLKTVTIAPEAGTERLRDVINKGLSDEDIEESVVLLAKLGVPNLRFYFMIGLPTEEESDIEGIIEITKKCRNIFIDGSRVHGRVGNITLSINCYVPKPFTPFQWHPMEDEKSLKTKLRRIKKGLAPEANIEVTTDAPRLAYIQGMLSRGDRRLSGLLVKVHENGGDWRKAIKGSDIDPAFYTTRARKKEELFPWDLIDIGVKKDYLWSEYERGLAGKFTPPCNLGPCTRCGIC
ncbi:MAG: radical SAM protein [bacterium]|nr:radical SAM protein [bacterium]